MPSLTRRLAALAILATALAGCSSSTDDSAAPVTTSTTAAATSSPSPVATTASGLTATAVVDAFEAAGLPIPNVRYNTDGNCPDLGCTELITTDAISVYSFPIEESAITFAEALAAVDGGHRDGLIVLNYVAARTPAADRPRYEKVLAGLQ